MFKDNRLNLRFPKGTQHIQSNVKSAPDNIKSLFLQYKFISAGILKIIREKSR